MLLTFGGRADGKTVDVPVDLRDEKNPFSSGATGYFAGGKVTLAGVEYQLSMSLVQIGTKDDAGAPARRKLALEIAKAKEAKRLAKAAKK